MFTHLLPEDEEARASAVAEAEEDIIRSSAAAEACAAAGTANKRLRPPCSGWTALSSTSADANLLIVRVIVRSQTRGHRYSNRQTRLTTGVTVIPRPIKPRSVLLPWNFHSTSARGATEVAR